MTSSMDYFCIFLGGQQQQLTSGEESKACGCRTGNDHCSHSYPKPTAMPAAAVAYLKEAGADICSPKKTRHVAALLLASVKSHAKTVQGRAGRANIAQCDRESKRCQRLKLLNSGRLITMFKRQVSVPQDDVPEEGPTAMHKNAQANGEGASTLLVSPEVAVD